VAAPFVAGDAEVGPAAVTLPVAAVALLASMMLIWRIVVLVSVLAPGRWLSTLTAI
jgi:hypothetical protein